MLPPPQTLKLSCPPPERPAPPSSSFARPSTPAAAAGGGLVVLGTQAEGRHIGYTTAERVPFTVQVGGLALGPARLILTLAPTIVLTPNPKFYPYPYP